MLRSETHIVQSAQHTERNRPVKKFNCTSCLDSLSRIAAHLFVLGKQTFLIMVDYWSKFFEVVEIHKKTAQVVIITDAAATAT